MRLRRLLMIAVLLIPTAAANGADLKPPARFIHKGACPFECCTYRDWKTEKPVHLVDRPEGNTRVASVAQGQIVQGLTGEVISKPVRMIADADFPDTPIRKGSPFYRLHNEGEGFWAAWYRGHVYSVELGTGPGAFPPTAAMADPSIWWVKIRTRTGVTGWTLEDGQFSNQDSCG